MDQLRGQHDGDRIAQDRRQGRPLAVRHEDPHCLSPQQREDRQRNELANPRRPIPFRRGRHDRHGNEIQGHQEHGNHQQGPAGRFQLPTMMGIEGDAEEGRRDRYEDEEFEVGDLVEGLPQADHQRDRRTDEEQSADQFAPANIPLLHESRQHLAPGPRRLGRWLRSRPGHERRRCIGARRRLRNGSARRLRSRDELRNGRRGCLGMRCRLRHGVDRRLRFRDDLGYRWSDCLLARRGRRRFRRSFRLFHNQCSNGRRGTLLLNRLQQALAVFLQAAQQAIDGLRLQRAILTEPLQLAADCGQVV